MENLGKRWCLECPGLEWEKWQLAEHAEHLAGHNPSPAQWVEAYKRIQEGKERAKAG